MELPMAEWLSAAGAIAFRVSAALFVAVNLAAAAVFVTLRDRSVVQHWTSPWLAANLLLLGAGVGLPAVAALARLAVYAVGAMTGGLVTGRE